MSAGIGTTRVVTIRPLDVDAGIVEVRALVDPELVQEAQRDGDGSVVALAVAMMLLMSVKASALLGAGGHHRGGRHQDARLRYGACPPAHGGE